MARFRRKDLKRPDAFVTTSQRVFAWALSHQREFLLAGGLAAAVLVVVGGYSAYSGAQHRQANEDLARALAPLRAEKYDEAATQLTSVADTWSSTGAGRIARLYAADAEIAAGRPERAAAELQKALAGALPADYLHQQAALNLGLALEQKQDIKGAAEHYDRAAAMQGPYRALALLRAARMRERLEQRKRAVELYETFLREFPAAPEAEFVEARLQNE